MAALAAQPKIYNRKLDLLPASSALERLGGEVAVAAALSIIREEGLADAYGIRLLHKHNTISQDEIMHEGEQFDEQGYCLVTQPVPLSNADTSRANSWQILMDCCVPLEYSDPKLLIDAGTQQLRTSVLIDKLRRTLSELNASHLLGLSVNYSGNQSAQYRFDDYALLESTNPQVRSNVMRFVPRNDPRYVSAIKTRWLPNRLLKRTVALDGSLLAAAFAR